MNAPAIASVSFLAVMSASLGQAVNPQPSVPVPGTTTFALLPAHRISIDGRLDCRAIATSFTSEKDNHLETVVSGGTDHLTIVRNGKALKVTANHEKSGIVDDFGHLHHN